MGFIDSIFSLVWDISDYFYNAYSEVRGWVWPFSYLQYPLYALYQASWFLLTPIANFGDWVRDVSTRVSNILSQVDILSLLRTWLTYAENAWSWVLNAWQNVTGIINTWWSSASQIVQVWVNDAKQYATSLVAAAMAMVTNLQAAWDTFKGKIPSIDAVIAWWSNWAGNLLAFVNNWWKDRLLDVNGLINSAFTVREGMWAGWQDWRGKVTEFFTDPEKWVYDRLDAFFERFW